MIGVAQIPRSEGIERMDFADLFAAKRSGVCPLFPFASSEATVMQKTEKKRIHRSTNVPNVFILRFRSPLSLKPGRHQWKSLEPPDRMIRRFEIDSATYTDAKQLLVREHPGRELGHTGHSQHRRGTDPAI